MGDVFYTRLRRVGSSFGVIIPKEQINSLGVKVGQEIGLAVIPRRDPAEIERWFGSAKGAPPFQRDKRTREF